MTRGKIAAAGALSGVWIGLFVAITISLFSSRTQLGLLITTPLLRALFGLAWGQFGYSAATRQGHRDFAPVSQVFVTKYEVLVAHTHIARARTPRDDPVAEDDLAPAPSPAPQPAASKPRPPPSNFRR